MARELVFVLVASATVTLAPARARAEGEAGGGPCDALVDYLHEALVGPPPVVPGILFDARYRTRERDLEQRLRSTSPRMPRTYTVRVTPACRAETRGGEAPEASEAARAWTQLPDRGWIDRGRILRCTMQDPAAFTELADWMRDGIHPDARAVCATELATWPEAEELRAKILARVIRTSAGWTTWEIDEAVVAAATVMGSAVLREQLVTVLATAHERHALGYDRLRAAVCTDDGSISDERARVCSTLPVEAEDDWSRGERTNQWLVRGAATSLYALSIATAARDQTSGRDLTTAAGVLGGMATGVLVTVVAAEANGFPRKQSEEWDLQLLIVGSTIVGGVLGGVAAHALAGSPGSRAIVTAVSLAPVYAVAISLTID